MKTKKERASWPMKDWEVRVIRDGSKTQARQVAKCKYKNCHLEMVNGILEIVNTKESEARTELLSPYGQPGDQLWGARLLHIQATKKTKASATTAPPILIIGILSSGTHLRK